MNTRTTTRNIVVEPRKRKYGCSYCGSNHSIDVCYKTNEEIQRLDKIGINCIVLGYYIFGYNKRTIYLEVWLNSIYHSLSRKQIQALGYKWGHGNNLFRYWYEYIKDIIKMYDDEYIKQNDMVRILMMDMDVNIINEFIQKISKYNTVEQISRIKNKLAQKMLFRQFPIKVINDDNIKKQKIIYNSECIICLIDDIPVSNFVCTDCGHKVCVSCFKKLALTVRDNGNNNDVNDNDVIKCPMCRNNINEITVGEKIIHSIEKYCCTALYYQKQKCEQEKKQKCEQERLEREERRLREYEEFILLQQSERETENYRLRVIKYCEIGLYVIKRILFILLIIIMIIMILMLKKCVFG